MQTKYEKGWNLEKFMEMNNDGIFDKGEITDYLVCTELSYTQEDVEYAKENGVTDFKPYIYCAMDCLE